MRVKWVFTVKDNDGKRLLFKERSLSSALGLSLKEHKIIAFTGGGGKTSAMFSLADELAEQGNRVIVTTSTHIFFPKDREVVAAQQAETVSRYMTDRKEVSSPSKGWVLVTGEPAPEGKLKGMPLKEIEKLAGLGDVLLVEADGAKQMPFKIPQEGEPVLLKNTDMVIGCVGLDCIGKPWEEKCFRWELAKKLFGWQIENSIITPAQAAQVLISTKGMRKNAGCMEYRILLNKADDETSLSHGLEVIASLETEWWECCVLTSFFGLS